MPKRKRDSEVPVEDSKAAVPSAQQQRVQHKLQHGTVKLGHAFKIAKGLERQKLGRRRKNDLAQKDGKSVQRIDAEIDALKALEGIKCARSHLYKSLLKIKAVAASVDLPDEVRQPVILATDAPSLNVIARLCNSNPVKEALSAVLVDVLKALGIQLSKEDGVKKRRIRAKDLQDQANPGESSKTAGDGGGTGATNEKAGLELEGSGSESGDDDGINDDHSDDDLGAFDQRLASSDEEGGGEYSDVEELERQLEREGIRKTLKGSSKKYSHAADLMLPTSKSPSPSPSPEPSKAPAPRKSAFLPSLTLGGYISGSGSELDGDDIDVAPKKNRRGQRARQQIWEKKFGARAKHVQNGDRSKGWDPKRGATDDAKPRSKIRSTDGKPRGRGGPVGGDRGAVKSKDGSKTIHRDDSGPIHPSWAAAKLAKERKEAPVAFQGKKITFD